MTPKEKAYQLWNKYAEANILTVGKYSNYRGLTIDHARVCALIAVDEILNELPEGSIDYGVSARRRFFEEVKQEIEKL